MYTPTTQPATLPLQPLAGSAHERPRGSLRGTNDAAQADRCPRGAREGDARIGGQVLVLGARPLAIPQRQDSSVYQTCHPKGEHSPLAGHQRALVPRERRVFAFGMASLIYTTILSLWNSKRARAEDEDLPPDPRIPLPRPPRAAIRLRRVIRATQRATRTLVRTARERL